LYERAPFFCFSSWFWKFKAASEVDGSQSSGADYVRAWISYWLWLVVINAPLCQSTQLPVSSMGSWEEPADESPRCSGGLKEEWRSGVLFFFPFKDL